MVMYKPLASILEKRNKDIAYYIEKPNRMNPREESFYIAIIYSFFGLVWILLSDTLLNFLIKDPVLYRQIQTYKGWMYVIITTLLIYWLVRSRMSLIQKALKVIFTSYEELSTTFEELIAIEEELRYQKNFTENIIKDAPVIIAIWDNEGRIKSINPFAQELFGYTEEEVFNKCWLDIYIPEENRFKMESIIKRIKRDKELKNHESQFITKDGKILDILWNSNVLNISDLKDYEIISVGTNITERKADEERFRRLAYYDSLTGLPNRLLFEKEINKLINQKNTKFMIAYIDCDNFKYINDTLGHHVGNEFLKYIGICLEEEISHSSIVARFGGDEFAILFREKETFDILNKIESIKTRIGTTWSIHNYHFFISLSIGIAIYPQDGADATQLFKNADIAMYEAKKTCKNSVAFYNNEMQSNNIKHVQIANQLQYAIENNEFRLYYQPKFRLDTEKIYGMEALIRWFQPEKGFISPDEFIPLSEETGQIFNIERWVIKTALIQKKELEERGFIDMEISINLSSKTLTSDVNFMELDKLFSSFNIDYSKITIEITETAIIADVNSAIERLKVLKTRGLKIALDDFGTGYSSLTYLKNLPIDIIKLDRNFVKSIEDNTRDAVIIKSILSMAQDLNYKVVAEGIETKEQLDYLRKHHCEGGQGYLFSKPIPMEEVYDILSK
ncbi:sensor domain-containing protein [Alkaliphilus peptidifermentans]|uniref:PAS domain S-box-containing protein/diguanylate cyclase (GGDEF) domain-containing protein n=1 Tax=Alkaliphilus peptidifermentans DSM 18978 TaxID=1120976 RepID=A0A1G5GMG1_9FIRM|nr:EAL domain-containing protein [Alkaliphilus peptidifermentans]SCY52400.1 PAS domain S-box-containing protein/diguanylate cyclase (GGDEF) domain-containing protein [Alkaliphilus peptidifermentans DSM 18978]